MVGAGITFYMVNAAQNAMLQGAFPSPTRPYILCCPESSRNPRPDFPNLCSVPNLFPIFSHSSWFAQFTIHTADEYKLSPKNPHRASTTPAH